MNHILVCTECDEVIIKNLGSETKIRGKVLLFRDDSAYVICKGCNTEVKVTALKLDQDIIKSMVDRSRVRLFIKKGNK